ncbi:MAG: class I SAM-dependent methyltransferase [Thermoactinospora sp.]|nr:class I SAM-dependent methyltransferase [Thermoactinospora sp.]
MMRDLLLKSGYTIDGVRERLGDVAATALSREELVPALRATRELDPLAVLIRQFWLGVEVPEELVPAELAPLKGYHVQPWGDDGYLVSDRKVRPGDAPLRPDHVVGAGGASANLAQLASRRPVERALDLGTGCGVQVLSLAGRAANIVATDLNPRAIELARLSWELSGISGVETRVGSLFEPVDGELFDLIVSNPPFVISPARRFTYREVGGDSFCRDLVRQAPRFLNPGGQAHFLANWTHVEGEDWRDRVGGWLGETGCDGWVVERDVQDPAEYVELWLRDAAEQGTAAYTELYDQWLGWFEEQKIEAIGFGWISMRQAESLDPVVRVERMTHQVQLPVGDYVDQVLDGIALAHRLDDLDEARLRVAEGVLDERIGLPGAEDPSRIVLRQTRGLMRSTDVGTVEAALAGVCDGELALGPLLNVIAELVGGDRVDAEQLRPLIAEGYFTV